MTKSFKQDNKPLRVVSVSLGSSTRNKKVVLELLNREIIVERIGVDANLKKAIELIKELDGKVDAFGLGGINLFLSFYGKKYKIRDANLIAKAAKKTPIVDGYGLKKYIEPKIIKELHETRIVDFAHKNILMVSALDREATAEVIYNMETNDLYGDLVFSVGFPYVLSKKDNIEL
ncbi:MAG: quinate 5-dehydrogenase, partial [Cyanobacteriota bacterium]